MKTIITKNIAVVTDGISICNYPGVVAISLKTNNNQIQIPSKHLDELIDALIQFRNQISMEHTIKDVITIDTQISQ